MKVYIDYITYEGKAHYIGENEEGFIEDNSYYNVMMLLNYNIELEDSKIVEVYNKSKAKGKDLYRATLITKQTDLSINGTTVMQDYSNNTSVFTFTDYSLSKLQRRAIEISEILAKKNIDVLSIDESKV